MTRVITVSSGKGGVGKTTFVANLAAALAEYKQSVIAVDGNVTTANLGLHLGIPLYPKTLQDVVNGTARISDALYYHPAGFSVLPADLSLSKLGMIVPRNLSDVFYKLIGGCDFILLDCAAGLGNEARSAIESSDEMITITHPELPAMTDALKLIKFAESRGTKHMGVVLNMVRGEKHEFSFKAVEDFLESPLLGHIPEDKNVRKSIKMKKPVVLTDPKSPASQHIKAIAAKLVGEEYTPRYPISYRLFGWMK